MPAPKSSGLDIGQLPEVLEAWLRAGRMRQMSPKTLSERKRILSLFISFCQSQGFGQLTRLCIEEFLAALGSKDRPWESGSGQPVVALKAISVQSYYRMIRAFVNWAVEEEYIEVNPMAKMKPPIARPDQVQPLTQDQVHRLLTAAKASQYPMRNVALISLILDSGLRASEVCNLTQADLDCESWSLRVLGKGNKKRTVYLGSRASQKALANYLRLEERQDDDPIFLSERGASCKLTAFTPHGILFVVNSCAHAAGLGNIGPHKLRHTFAFNFIRGGGTEFTLQTMLGHTSLVMTRKYVNLAGADMSAQARAVGTLDSVMKKR